jgi:hypothetical protein
MHCIVSNFVLLARLLSQIRSFCSYHSKRLGGHLVAHERRTAERYPATRSCWNNKWQKFDYQR